MPMPMNNSIAANAPAVASGGVDRCSSILLVRLRRESPNPMSGSRTKAVTTAGATPRTTDATAMPPVDTSNSGDKRSRRTRTVETRAHTNAPTPTLVCNRPGPESPRLSSSRASTTAMTSIEPTRVKWPHAIASTPPVPALVLSALTLLNMSRIGPRESAPSP
jgi:hypothetical protein